ncbi:extracellular solute-binding protein [Rhodospirillaceae bacterium SYSU D60014]|uniref:extracellular solute-binding protein n=1 Tax=Virgifigura deserti TaxID=2268457 RepID=UPI000E664FD6
MRLSRRAFATAALGAPFASTLPNLLGFCKAWAAEGAYAITAFGLEPVYPEGFAQWNYVNPDAPRRGTITAGTFGSFDTLNPFTLRGDSAAGVDLIYSSIGVGSADETSVIYGDLAESFEIADDRSWLILNLRREARFHDGHPVTAEDVLFTFEILAEKGMPLYRARLFNDMVSAEALDEHTVRVRFARTDNPELPLSIASLPVLPKHYWEGRAFDRLTMEPPLGSGPYRITELQAGRSITYERVADWWGAGLPQNRGLFNFERIRYDYYKDATTLYEAFKGGNFDYIGITDARQWSVGFKGVRAVEQGNLILEALPSNEPAGFGGLFFNLRRPVFQDVRVRQAIATLFDFESIQRTILFGLYRRINSYFENGEFAATGTPTESELAILEKFRGQLPEAVFGDVPMMPVTDGSGNIRPLLREAMGLLRAAGYEVRDGVMTHAETDLPLRFTIVYGSPPQDRVLLPFRQNLQKAGIDAQVRFVDGAQWGNMFVDKDYDMLLGFIPPLYPPGTELRDFFGSTAADVPGSQSLSGVKDKVLDELAEAVIRSETWDDRIAAARAFDRYARHLWLSVPFYYDDKDRIAYWDIFARPDQRPRFGLLLRESWWFDPSNQAALRENR